MQTHTALLSLFLSTLSACGQVAPRSPEVGRSQPPAVPAEVPAPTLEPTEVVGNSRFALPEGWSVLRADGAVALLNPGFRSTDTLEALVVVASEPRSSRSAGSDAVALLREQLPKLAIDLEQQQVDCRLLPKSVVAGELPGGRPFAELRANGFAEGRRPVTVWLGALAGERDLALVLVVALRGKDERFVAGGKQLLGGLQFGAPAATSANAPPAADDLAGLEFGTESFGSDSSLTTVYTFGRGGALQRRTMFSSPFGGSDQEARGRYERTGDAVLLRVGDDVVRGVVQRRGAQVVAIRIGKATYRRL